jgi:uncharacterized protein YjiS (DUF1127 family)
MTGLASDGSRRGAEVPTDPIATYEQNSSILTVAFRTLSLWLNRWRCRRALEDLAERNNYLMADVGLTHEDALREAAKPFWRA